MFLENWFGVNMKNKFRMGDIGVRKIMGIYKSEVMRVWL